jgi:hypothetical protein
MPIDQQRPLGIRPEVTVSREQLRALELLAAYDLSLVRERLLKDSSIPSSWIDEAILEFRRYLGLQIIAPGPLPMFSKHVDDVWHACLLFSRIYADLCETVFGRFVHHDPKTGHEEEAAVEAWAVFAASYEHFYGPVGRLWRTGRARQ